MRKSSRLSASLLFLCFAAVPFSACGAATEEPFTWPRSSPEEQGMDSRLLARARDYALTGGGSGYITRHGVLVMEWGDPGKRYDLKSTTKSFGATALGVAIMDGKVRLGDKAVKLHPAFGVPPRSNLRTGWLRRITLFHLATQTAGFAKPGGYEKLLFAPGTMWHYSDGGPNWLAECLTLVYRRDLKDLMFERVFSPLGITPRDLTWRKNAYRAATIEGIPRREFGSGISGDVDAMARLGYLYLKGGVWRGRRLLPEKFIDRARTSVPGVVGLPVLKPDLYNDASDHYGLLWWNNADGTIEGVPRDAFWSWGLYESLILVIPSLDIVVARAGRSWKRKPEYKEHYDVLKPFFRPIAASVKRESRLRPPCPDSECIAGIVWAPRATIVRRARGSDNWPLTWADDDRLYTAYGDGRGFEPKIPVKLSLGFAKIEGGPGDFRGINIRSPTGERRGDGPRGEKASGILMVDGILYLWIRNAGNAQLAWSKDHAVTWKRCPWKFRRSFGCPTFLNFGKNYEGARDDFVYVYSPDSESAYEPGDRMILARVPRGAITRREAYEFFAGLTEEGNPKWTREIEKREAVFTNPGRCLRSSVVYDPPLGRYIWWQGLPRRRRGGEVEVDTRFHGGFSVFEAPEPWGPWNTVYFTADWDTGPGESGSFPTKWISSDGRTLHLVFSGEDSFSVRKATLILKRHKK